MASLEVYGLDENGNLIKKTIGGNTELSLTGSCVLATSATAPPGTLIADGSEVSRASYPELFAKIGTTYGEGDGVTTFALPDWRDEFPRFSGAARTVGSKQSDAIRNITGAVAFTVSPIYGSCVNNIGGETSALLGTSNGNYAYITSGSGNGNRNLTLDASRSVPTADENRPRNVAFLPCIVYL